MENQIPSSSSSAPRTKGADEKFCGSCGEAIKIQAEICPKCGVRQRPPFNKTALVLITFFLGGLGAHKFYVGKNIQGVLYLLFCWTFIPGIIAFVEFFIYALTSNEKLEKKYPNVKVGTAAIVLISIAAFFGVIFTIGVLAALAIPKFLDASCKAKASEFPTQLTAIYTGEIAYQAEKGHYAATLADLASSGVDVPAAGISFSYVLDNVTDSTFTGHAIVKTRFGMAPAGSEATINQKNEKKASSELQRYAPNWK
jgi:TM2 domain-containing membrane protein YozV/type II secretory pathway pseudopilin PulG